MNKVLSILPNIFYNGNADGGIGKGILSELGYKHFAKRT